MSCVENVTACTTYVLNELYSCEKLLMKFVDAFQFWLKANNSNRLEALYAFQT